MKKLITLILSLFLITNAFGQSECGQEQIYKYYELNDPDFLLNLESFESDMNCNRGASRCSGIRRIQCVVHIIHNPITPVGQLHNISEFQARSIIWDLNRHFRNLNGTGVDTQIEFTLADTDPSGNATNGITRYSSSVSNFVLDGVEDNTTQSIKQTTSWDPARYLNIWVVSNLNDNNGNPINVAGYAYLYPTSPSYLDGVVLRYNFAGTVEQAQSNSSNSTGVHEVGHYLSLYHTFEGDNNGISCPPNAFPTTQGDRCTDTPPHKRGTTGACDASGLNICDANSSNGLWVNNHMSYTGCRNEFTSDQKGRMDAQLIAVRPDIYSCESTLCNFDYIASATAQCSSGGFEINAIGIQGYELVMHNAAGQLVVNSGKVFFSQEGGKSGIFSLPYFLAGGWYNYTLTLYGHCGNQETVTGQVLFVTCFQSPDGGGNSMTTNNNNSEADENSLILNNRSHTCCNPFLTPTLTNDQFNYGYVSEETLGSDLVVNTGGLLNVNANLPYKYGGSTFGSPNTNSTKQLTICSNSTLTVISGGEFILGDPSNNTKGKVIVESGSTLRIANNGTLKINDNSILIVQPGANLIFENGGNIQLNGNNAVLEIQGTLQIGNNTTFTFSGSGFVRWDVPYQPGSNVIAGVNSKIKFQGSSRTDKVLEIASTNLGGDCWMPTNLTLFQVQSGQVEFKNNGRLVLPGAFSLIASNFVTPSFPSVISRGLWVAGQTGMQANGCHFYGTQIEGALIYGGNPLKLYSCKFFDGALVYVDGAGFQLSNCTFDNCGQGIQTQDIYMPSLYYNGTMTNCFEAINNYTSNTTITLNKVNITAPSGSTWGVFQQQGLLNLKCTNISGSDDGLWLYDGAGLNSSIVGNTGGYSKISGVYSNLNLYNAGTINLDNGFNDLRPGNKIITGHLSISCGGNPFNIPANQNLWLNNNTLDPNTYPGAPAGGYYPNAYNNPTAIGSCDVRFIDNNRGATATCGQFDPDPVLAISNQSIFKNCTTCPQVNGNFFNNVRMDAAILQAMEQMEIVDTTKNDITAIQMFNEILLTPSLNLNDPDVAFLSRYVYQMAKTSIQNCFNTGRITKADNIPNLHPCANHYLQILNVLRQPVTADNFKEQFYLELDNALAYYWVGRFQDAIHELEQIENCFLGDEEYRLINYWIETIKLKDQFVSDLLSLDDYIKMRGDLPDLNIPTPTHIDPTANINSTALIGVGTTIGAGSSVGQNVIIGKNVKIGDNVSIDKDAIINDNVVISDNSIIGKNAQINSNSIIGNNVNIDKLVIIGSNAEIKNNVSIGKETKIGGWVRIDEFVLIDKLCLITDGAYIGKNSSISQEVKIGEHAVIRRNTSINKSVKVGDRTLVDNNVMIDNNAIIGKDVTILETLSIGKSSKVCDGQIVSANVSNYATLGSCTNPSSPSVPFTPVYDEIFAVAHAHIYGKMSNGFTTNPIDKHFFVNEPITFDVKEYGNDIVWDFGNCSQSNSPQATYTFTNPGVYVITLKVNPLNGCNGVAQVYIGSISVHPKPTIQSDVTIPNCASANPVEFDVQFNPGNVNAPGCFSKYGTYCTYGQLKVDHCRMNFTYDFGDNTTLIHPLTFSQLGSGFFIDVHLYENPNVYGYHINGDYEVLEFTTEEWNSIGYSTESYSNVSLLNTIEAAYDIDPSICANSSFNLQNHSTAPFGLVYQWYLSDGQYSFANSPTFTITNPGQYEVMLIASDSLYDCTDTLRKTIIVSDCQLHSATNNASSEGQAVNYNLNEAVKEGHTINSNLYPNPNQGEFSIVITGIDNVNGDVATLRIYDITGKVIYVQNNVVSGKYLINLSNLPGGVYHWQIISETMEETIRGNFIISGK